VLVETLSHAQSINRSIVLTVDRDSTAEELMPLAINKHCACNWHLPTNAVYRLLYPDG